MAIVHLGNAGTWQDSTSASSQNTASTFTWNIGELLIAVLASDNYETTDGNTSQHSLIYRGATGFNKKIEYSNSNSAAGAGAVISIWACIAKNSIVNNYVTLTYGNNITKKALTIHRFSIEGGLLVHSSTSTDGEDASDPSSKSINDLIVGWEYLAIHGIASESNDTTTLTTTSNFSAMTQAVTSGGTSASNIGVRAEYRVFTAASSTITSDPTLFSADHASALICLHETSVYKVQGQAQSRIKSLVRSYSQSQAYIKATSNSLGLAKTYIQKVNFGQTQALTGTTQNLYSFIGGYLATLPEGAIWQFNDQDRIISGKIHGYDYITHFGTYIPAIKANYTIYLRGYFVGPDPQGTIEVEVFLLENDTIRWSTTQALEGVGAGAEYIKTYALSVPNSAINAITDFSQIYIAIWKYTNESNHQIIITGLSLNIPANHAAQNYAQSNAFIYSGVPRYGQAQATIIYVPQKFGQSQSKIKQTYKVWGQSRVFITYNNYKTGLASAAVAGIYTSVIDTFTRSISDGLGDANTGGTYVITSGPSTDFDVDGSKAVVSNIHASPYSRIAVLPKTSFYNFGFSLKFSLSALPSSESNRFIITVSNPYMSSLDRFDPAFGLSLLIDSIGTIYYTYGWYNGGVSATNTGLTYTVGETWNFRGQLFKFAPNKIYFRSKVWKNGEPEPGWLTPFEYTITDSDSYFTSVPGHIGFEVSASGSNSTANATIDDFNIFLDWKTEYAQAQAAISGKTIQYALAQTKIKIESYKFSQAQSKIKQNYKSLGQTQAWIESTYRNYGQALAQIGTLYLVYAQSQAKVRGTSRVYGLSQVATKQVYRTLAQAQGQLKQSYQGYANTQVVIYYPSHIVPVSDVTNNGWIGVVIS